MEWTIEQVKRELPHVKARVSKNKTIWAQVSGRLNRFASVSIGPEPNCPTLWVTQEFSWDAVTKALNENRALDFQDVVDRAYQR